jgi:hypothetical protein
MASTVACSATTDVYYPSANGANGAPPGGPLTPADCAVICDRMCDVVAAEHGQQPDLEWCRGLEVYGNMQRFCVAKGQCLGRPYYDCMSRVTTSDQVGRCADEADRRCSADDTAAAAPLDGWIRHASPGGFSVMMPSEPTLQDDGLHGEFAPGAPGSACGSGWIDRNGQSTDADLDDQVSQLELGNAAKKRVMVLGKYRGMEISGTNEKGQQVHARIFGVGRRLFVLMIINESSAAEADAFFESFQLRQAGGSHI